MFWNDPLNLLFDLQVFAVDSAFNFLQLDDFFLHLFFLVFELLLDDCLRLFDRLEVVQYFDQLLASDLDHRGDHFLFQLAVLGILLFQRLLGVTFTFL